MYDGALRVIYNRLVLLENTVERLVDQEIGGETSVQQTPQQSPEYSRAELEKFVECSIEKYIETYSEEQYNNLKKGLGNIVSMKIEQNLESKLKEIFISIDDLKKSLQDIQTSQVVQNNVEPTVKSKKGRSINNKKTLDITGDI